MSIIDDPFLVHSLASRPYASFSKAGVILGASGDGVHVINTSTLHIDSSYTLGPSCSFLCAPVGSKGKEKEKIYGTLAATPDAVTCFGADGKTERIVADEPIFSLISTDDQLIVVTERGTVVIVDSDSLQEISRLSLATDVQNVFQLKPDVLLVTKSQVHILSTADNTVLLKKSQDLPEELNNNISAISATAEFLSFLSKTGKWSTYALPSLEPVSLLQLAPDVTKSFRSQNSSIIGLTSSHALLATPSPSNSPTDLALMVIDLRFSIVLDSKSIPLPLQPTPQTTLSVNLSLGPAQPDKFGLTTSGHILATLSSTTGKEKQGKKGKKSDQAWLYALPYSIPTNSSLAAAMGKGGPGSLTSVWIQNEEVSSNTTSSKNMGEARLSKDEEALVKVIKTANSSAALAALAKWESDKKEFNYVLTTQLLQTVLVDSKKDAYSPEVLRFLLDTRGVASNMLYHVPGRLLGALRNRGDATSILLAFARVNDLSEDEIIETLQAILVEHVKTQRATQKADTDSNDDEMAVDTPIHSSTLFPSLQTFLSAVLSYPTSAKPLLAAVKKYLAPDAEGVTALLEVMDNWVVRRSNIEEKLWMSRKEYLRSRKRAKEQRAVVEESKEKGKQKAAGIATDAPPPLSSIAAFTSTLLDASFVSLLQYPPSHRVLKSLRKRLQDETVYAAQMEKLRGPLEPFWRVEVGKEMSLAEGGEETKKESKKRLQESLALVGVGVGLGDVGVYKVEELVL